MAVSLTNDEPTRDRHANKLPQYAIILLATLANFSIGTCIAWISPVWHIYITLDVSKVNRQDISWLCGLVPLGAAIGSLPAEVIANKIGRHRTIKIITPFLVGCWLVIGLTANKVWIFLARFVAGIVCGAFSIIIPIYLTEIVERRFRESLSMICQLQVYLGILFTYFTGFSDDQLTIALLCAVAPTMLSVASVVMPESPVWLMAHNREEEAKEVLKSLRRTEGLTQEDMTRIENNIEQTGCVSGFKAHTKATIIAFSLMSIQQMTGMNILIAYASRILIRLQFPLNTNVASIILGLVPIIATCFYKNLLTRMKMKLLLFLSLCVMSISLFILSAYFRLQNTYIVSSFSWVPFLSIVLLMVAYAVGCEPVCWILIERIFTGDVRNMAITGSMVCNWISSFMSAKGFQDILSLMEISTVFAMYGISTLMGTAFVARMVPETEGKSEEEVQMELRGWNQEDTEVPTCC